MDPTSVFDFDSDSDSEIDSELDFDSELDSDLDIDLIEDTLKQLEKVNFINLKMTYHKYTKHGPLEFDSDFSDSDSDN